MLGPAPAGTGRRAAAARLPGRNRGRSPRPGRRPARPPGIWTPQLDGALAVGEDVLARARRRRGKTVRRLSCRPTTWLRAACSAATSSGPELQDHGDVVGRRTGVEAVEEPQPALGEGQRDGPGVRGLQRVARCRLPVPGCSARAATVGCSKTVRRAGQHRSGPAACGRPAAWRAASGRRGRRSRRRRRRASSPRTSANSPATISFARRPRGAVAAGCPGSGPAAPGCPACRWRSAAARSAATTRRAPCSPAALPRRPAARSRGPASTSPPAAT